MESFLVNADRLDPIIKALVQREAVPDKVDEDLLKSIGFEDPSDLLVIHILKELNMVNPDNSPTPLFEKLINKSTTRKAIAEGTVYAYQELLTENPGLYKRKSEDIRQKLSEFHNGKKTELIIKYMSNTFIKLVEFAGEMEVERAFDALEEKESSNELVETFGKNSNGSVKSTEDQDDTDDEKDLISEEMEKAPSDLDEENDPVESSEAEEEDDDSMNDVFFEDTSDSEEETLTDESESETAQPETEMEEQDDTLLNENAKSFSNMDNIDQDTRVKQAYIKKSDLLYKLDRYEELLPNLTEIIKSFDDSGEKTFQEAVNRSIIRRGTILKKLGRTDELLPALEEIISRFESSDNEYYYREVSNALLNKADLLEDQAADANALLKLYEKIINRLQDNTNEPIASRVDQIFLNRVDLLYQFGDDEQTLKVLDQTINRFESTGREEHFMQDAMFKKAEILEQLNRDEEALEAYTEFIERFGVKTNA